jgi:hypothetical protein
LEREQMFSQSNRAHVSWAERPVAWLVVMAASVLVTSGRAQDADRQLWDTEFLKKRPVAETPAPPRVPPIYRRAASPPDPKSDATSGEVLGITIWRLRAPRAIDSRDARLLLQDDERGGTAEWTPERVEAGTIFTTGERIRLSIESSRPGFLYVVDREQYADGSMSDPYLIFPTQRIRAGNHAVAAGKVIELPENSAFRLKPLRPDYTGEQLTLLVTAQPLTDIRVGPQLQRLDPALVQDWERQWSARTERFEMVGGAGKTYTKTDRQAGAEGRLLTQEDELPQTLFRIAAKPDSPLLLILALRISTRGM